MAYTASQVIAAAVYIDNLYFPAQMANSRAYAETTSTGSAVCIIKKYTALTSTWAQIAKMTFTAGNAVPAFSDMASAVTMVPGDRLKIEAPVSPDATLDGVVVTLFSERYL